MNLKSAFISLVCIIANGMPIVASAQAYPSRPIMLVVPFPAGGTSDFLARLVARNLTESLGQPVVVENRTGAGGIIGTDAVAKAPPDGYTLLLGNFGPIAVAPSLYKTLKYDPRKDLAPISLIAKTPNVILVRPDFPARNLAEFIDYARRRPGKLSYASAGVGTSNHVGTELLKQLAGIDMVHIPYRGSAPMETAVMGGQVEITLDPVTACLPLVKAGRLRALAVAATSRSSVLPDVPTAIEAGLPGFENGTWNGVLAPAGTPGAILDKLSAEIRKILSAPAIRGQLEATGSQPAPSTPTEYKEFIASEIIKWEKVIRTSNIRADE